MMMMMIIIIIIIIITIKVIIIIVIPIAINSYIIMKHIDNDNGDENDAQNKDSKKY